MKAILVKELRENAKWAAIMLLGMALLIGYAVHADDSQASPVSSSVVVLCPLGCGVAGFILGLLQIIQDARKGRWQFVTHRPVSRSLIFLGKILVGLVLYPLAVGIPLAVVMLWMSMPGHAAVPFDWHAILPRIADVLTGFPCYFAGICVATRNARWIGSRLAPAGFGLAAIALTYAVLTFSDAVLVVLASLLILVPTAWRLFAGGEEFELHGVLARMLFTIVVGAGVAMATAISVSIVGEGIKTFFLHPEFTYRYYEMLKDGQIVIMTRSSSGVSAADLSGKPIDLKPLGDDSYAYIGDSRMWNRVVENRLSYTEAVYYFGFRRPERYMIAIGHDNDSTSWWYLPLRQTMEGYSQWTNLYVGSIGSDGYQPAPAPPRPFDEPLYTIDMDHLYEQYQNYSNQPVACAHSAYLLDVEHHHIRPLYTAAPDDPIYSVGNFAMLNGKLFDGHERMDKVVVTRSMIHIFDDSGAEILKTNLDVPQALLRYCQLDAGEFVIWYSWTEPGTQVERNLIKRLDPNAMELSRVELPPLPEPEFSDPLWLTAFEHLGDATGAKVLAHFVAPDFELLPMRDVICCIVISILAALAILPVGRRYALPAMAMVVWIVLALLLGPAGILLLISMRSRPARVVCESCGKRRWVMQATCPHCGKPFAEPKGEGIEIFEELGAVGAKV